MTLGTASALPTANRYPSAHILTVHERLFLIDCGEGTQMQLRRYGVPFHRIDNIFISHLHGDHLFGIFGLMSTFSMAGRSAPLHIYAPKDFSGILGFFRAHFGEGIRYEIIHHPVQAGRPAPVYENRSVEVLAFPLQHRGETYGYLFREKTPERNVHKYLIEPYGLTLFEIARLKEGQAVIRTLDRADGSVLDSRRAEPEETAEAVALRNREGGERYFQRIDPQECTYLPYTPRSFAYCSDTAPFAELAGWIKGTDLLYHEATYLHELKAMAGATCHSTAADAAECARQAGVSRLVIGHFSSRYKNPGCLLEEARSVFPATDLAREGTKFEIPLNRVTKQ